jgi:ABC-2 type transport system permease protein
MNMRRISILLQKELSQGTRSFIFVFATVIPVIVSLMVSLVFGRLFTETPRIGILNEGDSQLVALFQTRDHIETRVYTEDNALRYDVERGVVDMGVIVPVSFDAAVKSSEETDLTIYFWGEGQRANQAVLVTALANTVVEISGRGVPATVEPVMLGGGEIASWSERLLPLLVLMSIVLGGTLVPAVSLVDEKQRRTLQALTITPVSVFEVLAAKALLGIGVSFTMATVILILNHAFGANPLLLMAMMALGTIAAGVFGVLLGTLVKDMGGLFTIIKSMAIVLYAPAIIELIPQLPAWVAQFFPTYYLIAPIQNVALKGAEWADISGQVVILVGIIGVLVAALVIVVNYRERRQLLYA